MKTKKFIKGKLYLVTFEDHAKYIEHILIAEVVGWLVSEDDDKIVMSYWKVIDEDEETVKENYEYTTIIRKNILSKRCLR